MRPTRGSGARRGSSWEPLFLATSGFPTEGGSAKKVPATVADLNERTRNETTPSAPGTSLLVGRRLLLDRSAHRLAAPAEQRKPHHTDRGWRSRSSPPAQTSSARRATSVGSNWLPAPASSSPRASSTASGSRYRRGLVIASK